MIVKMQISTPNNEGPKMVLIYDKERKYQYQTVATKEVLDLMNGRLKVFFAARMNGTQIEILDEIKEQDW